MRKALLLLPLLAVGLTGQSDVGVEISLAMTLVFLALCAGIVTWMFRTGYRLKP